jgi:two-component system, chemotaxis family, protein-glutamate methylesterase/glutaminase
MSKIIIIGASTGGPTALDSLLQKIPESLGVAIVVIQHMPAKFTASLAERLNNVCNLTVSEAQDREIIENNHIYIVPGEYHFFFEMPGPRVHLLHSDEGLSPSVDMGIISAVDHYGPGVIGVVLSGMGNDGVIGARTVKQFGGTVLVQSEESSEIFGMPKAIIEAGLADEVLPIDEIAGRLVELV